jgi:hypothetical protein
LVLKLVSKADEVLATPQELPVITHHYTQNIDLRDEDSFV